MTTTARAYYNEVDPYAAQFLRNLISAGEIALGDVDTRDIRDVMPADLDGYTQCHFFAGVGIWSRALREAGWPDHRPVWTGSCPCQPFSAAGAGAGFDDERHLWPSWYWLIEQLRPETVFGEQVASNDGLAWADLVQTDLEAALYACGFIDTCAAGFRSFHIRQRLYFAALLEGSAAMPGWQDIVRRFGGLVDSISAGPQGHGGHGLVGHQPGWVRTIEDGSTAPAGAAHGLDNSLSDGRGKGRNGHHRRDERLQPDATDQGCGLADATTSRRDIGPRLSDQSPERGRREPANQSSLERLANTDGGHSGAKRKQRGRQHGLQSQSGRALSDLRADPADGYWRDADWLFCRDGKWRPVEPGTFPLAHAATGRMGRLRAYGNGLDLAQATGFIRAFLERDMAAPRAGNLFEWGA